MSAVNVVEEEQPCPKCGNVVPWRVQFSYGNVWAYEYRVGDRLHWGRDFPNAPYAHRLDVGKPGARRVVVLGTPEGCPICGYGVEDLLDYEVRVEDDRIMAVQPLTGRYHFPEDEYVVLG